MQVLFAESPLLFIGIATLLALLIGSFLNVVIYRLPVMMERDWRAQCDEISSMPASDFTRRPL